MSYRGAPLTSTNFVLDTFTATAGQTAFALTRAPASAQSVLCVINGATQRPTTNYTISGSTLTLTSGAGVGDSVWVVHLGVQGVLTTPADGSVTYAKLASDAQMPVLMSPVTASGTVVDFTSIPTGVKAFSLNLSGISTNGSSLLQVQLGDSGGVETTGYTSNAGGAGNAGASGTLASPHTSGFVLSATQAASAVWHGAMLFTLVDASTFTWAVNGGMIDSANALYIGQGGSKSLSAALDRVRLTATNGTDTFDAGKVSLSYWR